MKLFVVLIILAVATTLWDTASKTMAAEASQAGDDAANNIRFETDTKLRTLIVV